MKKFVKIILVLTLICFTACSTKQKEETLLSIEALLDEAPDSGLILTSVMKNKLLTRYEKAKVILYETIAKNKLDMDISFNTDIFNAAEIILKKGNDIEKAKVLLYAGRVSRESDEYENAILYSIQSKEYGYKTKDNDLKGLIMADIGKLNYREKHYDLSINNYNEAFYYFNKTNNYKNQISMKKMIGNNFFLLDKQDSAFYYYNEALKIAQENKNISAETGILINIGVLYNSYGDYINSIKLLKEALSKSCNKKDSLYIYMNLADGYYCINDFDSASYCINECINFIENEKTECETDTYFSAYAILSNIEEKKGNLMNALMLRDKLFDIADSLYSEIAENRLLEIQEKYEHDKIIIENQKLSLEKKNNALWALSITLICLILAITTFWIKRKMTVNEKNLIITRKKLLKLENSAEIYQKKISDTLRSLLIDKYEKVDYKLFDKILPYIISSLTANKEKLSPNEIAICCFYFLGFKKNYILQALNIDSKSFDSRCTDIRKKLGVEKRGSIGFFVAYNLTKN